MIISELNKRSPLRILDNTSNGGLGKGNIGVITARKGVGKTACLVHIATDQLFQDKHIIHVSFSTKTDHIISWYEDIFNKIAGLYNLENAMEVHDEIIKNRIIMTFNQKAVRLPQVAKRLQAMIQDGQFFADVIIIDGYDLSQSTEEELAEIKKLARAIDLEVWFSLTLDDTQMEFDDKGVPKILKHIVDGIEVIIFLKPHQDHIQLELVKDHAIYPDSDLLLKLDPQTLLIKETA